MIDPGLLFGELPLCQFGGAVEEGLQLLLLQLAVFPALQPFVGGEVVGGGEEGVADLVDDVLAGGFEGGHQLGFYLLEVVVDCLLKHAALGLHRVVEGKFAQQGQDLVFGEVERVGEVGVVLLKADLAEAEVALMRSPCSHLFI